MRADGDEGPFAFDDLVRLANKGKLKATDRIKNSKGQTVLAKDVSGLTVTAEPEHPPGVFPPGIMIVIGLLAIVAVVASGYMAANTDDKTARVVLIAGAIGSVFFACFAFAVGSILSALKVLLSRGT